MDSEVSIDFDDPRVRRNDSLSVAVAIHVADSLLNDVRDDTELNTIALTNRRVS